MTKTFSILGFVVHAAELERDMHKLGPAIVARACEMVCTEAKRVLGTYDYNWPQLQPETIARKIRGNSPLLETGKLRDSVEWNSHGNEGRVGTNLEIGVYQELGTSRIPPRSFLVGAAMRMEPEIHAMAARASMAVMAGKGLQSHEMQELLHLLHGVVHQAKKAFDDVTADGRKGH
jgi:phage gpG-like protein